MCCIQRGKGRILVSDGGRDDTAEDHFEEKLFLIKDRMKVSKNRCHYADSG